MQSRGHRLLAGLAVAIIVPVVSGCSPSKGCSAIGGLDGVKITLPAGVLSTPQRVSISVCLDGRCRQTHFDRIDRRFPTAFVAMPVPKNATVRLRISTKVGMWRGRGVTTVHTKPSSPNGPGCPPTVWLAAAALTQTGEVRGGS